VEIRLNNTRNKLVIIGKRVPLALDHDLQMRDSQPAS
jgi:hypothetical protein